MESESPGGTLLVLEPKSLRSFTTNDEYLFAMKEDLADWFACLYKMQIEADSFLTILETGVILCRHANEVQHFFKDWRQQGVALAMRSYFIRAVPEGHVTFRADVKPGTFQARDNVSNFITWCRNMGIPDVLRFETDDLVLRKNERSVILCLLEVARVGAKLGMLAPTLVRMEQEIDQELESDQQGVPPPQIKTCDLKSLDELVRELVGQCSCPVQFPMVKVGDGKYQIGDSRTLIFVRVLRNHVMVRVGGGWDTLENYLNKHDPCRCHFRGHRSVNPAGGASPAPKHQILRRASTSALIATRTSSSPSPSPSHPSNHPTHPSSPRRMSSIAAPASPSSTSSSSSQGKGWGGSGPFSKGPSPARSISPNPSPNQASTTTTSTSASSGSSSSSSPFHSSHKAGSPLRRSSSPAGPNGVRRLPSPSPSFINTSTAVAAAAANVANAANHLAAGGGGGGSSAGTMTSTRESRESSVGRSSSSGSRPSSPGVVLLAGGGGGTGFSTTTTTSSSRRQSLEQKHQQQQHQRGHQSSTTTTAMTPQHQAVRRCKSPSPGPSPGSGSGGSGMPGPGHSSRCVSPALSGNRTLPRPLSRGVSSSCIPRPQSPAAGGASNTATSAAAARRQLFLARSQSFDAQRLTSTSENATWRSTDELDAMMDDMDTQWGVGGEGGGGGDGGGEDEGDPELNMDQISTMTLSEFKQLISHSLSVPPPDSGNGATEDTSGSTRGRGSAQQGGRGSGNSNASSAAFMKRSSSVDGQNLSWSSVRDKARSVCNSLASSASSRRVSTGGGTAGNIIARRNLPRSPAAIAASAAFTATGGDSTPSTTPGRPKTPSSTGAGVERPKTPSSGMERPKTPVQYRHITSAYAYRPKTPTQASSSNSNSTSQTPTRPKTPTGIGSGVGGGAGVGTASRSATVNNSRTGGVERGRSRTPTHVTATRDADGFLRPKTPPNTNPRVQTTSVVSTADCVTSNPRVKSSSFVFTDDSDNNSVRSNNSSNSNRQPGTTTGLGSFRRSASLASSLDNNDNDNDNEDNGSVSLCSSSSSLMPSQSRRSHSPATVGDEDPDEGDNSEIAEVMDGGRSSVASNSASSSVSVRERPSTPSRIPKPSFTTARPTTPGAIQDSARSASLGRGVGQSALSTAGTAAARGTQRTLPRPSTPVGRSSAGDPQSTSERQQPSTASATATTPRRFSLQSATNNNNSSKSYTEMFHARRAHTPGPGNSSNSTANSSSRPTTPGPGSSGGGLTQAGTARRSSLARTADMAKLRKAKSVTNLLQESGRMSAVEISIDNNNSTNTNTPTTTTASGDGAKGGLRRTSLTQQRGAGNSGGEVLMVTRSKQGQHSVQVTDRDRNVTYTSGVRGRLQQQQQQSTTAASSSVERARSKTPGPGVGTRYQPRGIIRKPNNNSQGGVGGGGVGVGSRGGGGGQRGAHNKPLNRTEAWVDSTLHDPKRKQLPARPRRPMTPNSLSVADHELLSRPLEEIQAALPSPVTGTLPTPDPDSMEAPPEDPEMYKKMEQLFEKYREMELRASVCDTPGGGGGVGGGHHGNDPAGRTSRGQGQRGQGQGQGQATCNQSTVSSRSSSSLRTGVTNSASFSSGISSGLSLQTDSSYGGGNNGGGDGGGVDINNGSSPAAAAATAPSFYGNGAASNNGQHHHHQYYDDLNATDDSACVFVSSSGGNSQENGQQGQQGAPAVSADDIVDMDEQTLTSNPTALVSKIKEILQVRPRKEESGSKSKIPAPAFLSRSRRSKSVSNLTQESSLSSFSLAAAPVSRRESSGGGGGLVNGGGGGLLVDVTRDESTNSDVSSEYSRCETPVPKLTQPLTTGRSTLFRRERSVGGGRSMSQDEGGGGVSSSTASSVSSSSRRYYWDEDGEFV